MFLFRSFEMENSQEAVEPLRLNHADAILDILTRAMSTQTVIKLASYRLYVFTCFVLIAGNFIAQFFARGAKFYSIANDQTSRQESTVMRTVVGRVVS